MFSNSYLKLLKKTHNRNLGWGTKVKKLGAFYQYFEQWQPSSVLDYGCGKGVILEHLRNKYPNIHFDGYDPGFKVLRKIPRPKYDCIFSVDVLEHIEPNYLPDVLTHVNNLAEKYIWLRIDTEPARKFLPDGRNAHLIIREPSWWENVLRLYIDGNFVYTNFDKKGKFDVGITK